MKTLLVQDLPRLTVSPCSSLVDHHRAEKFRFKVNMYKLKEEREIEPRTLAHLVSSTLYERRYENTFKMMNQWIWSHSLNTKGLQFEYSSTYSRYICR